MAAPTSDVANLAAQLAASGKTAAANNPLAANSDKLTKALQGVANTQAAKYAQAAGTYSGNTRHNGILGDVLHVLDTPRAIVASAADQFTNALTGQGFDPGKLVSNAWNYNGTGHGIGAGDILAEHGVTNKWARLGLGFVGDVALDPLTYLAPEEKLTQLGTRGAEEALARHAASADALGHFVDLLHGTQGERTAGQGFYDASKQLSQYALDVKNAGTVSALDRTGLEALSSAAGTDLRGGIRLNVPGTGRIARGLHISPVEDTAQIFLGRPALGSALVRGIHTPLNLLRDTRLGALVAQHLGGADFKLRDALHNSQNPEEFTKLLLGQSAKRAGALASIKSAQDIGEKLKGIDPGLINQELLTHDVNLPQDVKDLLSSFQHPSVHPEGLPFDKQLAQFSKNVGNDVAVSQARSFGVLQDSFAWKPTEKSIQVVADHTALLSDLAEKRGRLDAARLESAQAEAALHGVTSEAAVGRATDAAARAEMAAKSARANVGALESQLQTVADNLTLAQQHAADASFSLDMNERVQQAVQAKINELTPQVAAAGQIGATAHVATASSIMNAKAALQAQLEELQKMPGYVSTLQDIVINHQTLLDSIARNGVSALPDSMKAAFDFTGAGDQHLAKLVEMLTTEMNDAAAKLGKMGDVVPTFTELQRISQAMPDRIAALTAKTSELANTSVHDAAGGQAFRDALSAHMHDMDQFTKEVGALVRADVLHLEYQAIEAGTTWDKAQTLVQQVQAAVAQAGGQLADVRAAGGLTVDRALVLQDRTDALTKEFAAQGIVLDPAGTPFGSNIPNAPVVQNAGAPAVQSTPGFYHGAPSANLAGQDFSQNASLGGWLDYGAGLNTSQDFQYWDAASGTMVQYHVPQDGVKLYGADKVANPQDYVDTTHGVISGDAAQMADALQRQQESIVGVTGYLYPFNSLDHGYAYHELSDDVFVRAHQMMGQQFEKLIMDSAKTDAERVKWGQVFMMNRMDPKHSVLDYADAVFGGHANMDEWAASRARLMENSLAGSDPIRLAGSRAAQEGMFSLPESNLVPTKFSGSLDSTSPITHEVFGAYRSSLQADGIHMVVWPANEGTRGGFNTFYIHATDPAAVEFTGRKGAGEFIDYHQALKDMNQKLVDHYSSTFKATHPEMDALYGQMAELTSQHDALAGQIPQLEQAKAEARAAWIANSNSANEAFNRIGFHLQRADYANDLATRLREARAGKDMEQVARLNAHAELASAELAKNQKEYYDGVASIDHFHQVYGNQPRIVLAQKKLIQPGFKKFGMNQGPAAIVDSMRAATKMLPGQENALLRIIDQTTQLWKAYQLATPGFHSRFAFGGMWNNFLYGMETGRYRDWMRWTRAFKNGSEANLPEAEREAYKLIDNAGLLTGGMTTGELGRVRGARSLNPLSPDFLPLQVSREGVHLGEHTLLPGTTDIQNMIRGSMAMDVMLKEWDPALHAFRQGAIDRAIQTVDKFHFNYGDLSGFEKGTLKRVIPFYTWTRKNVPLQIEQMFLHPGKFNRFTQLRNNVEDLSPQQNIIPGYYGSMWATRLPFSLGQAQQYATPRLPFLDVAKVGDLNDIMASLNPIARIPAEMYANKQFFTGNAFTGRYATVPAAWKAIPGFEQIGRALGVVKTDAYGEAVMTDKNSYLVESLLPLLGRARRLLPSDELPVPAAGATRNPNSGTAYSRNATAAWLSFMFGVGERGNSPQDQANAVYAKLKAVQGVTAQYHALGYPTTQSAVRKANALKAAKSLQGGLRAAGPTPGAKPGQQSSGLEEALKRLAAKA